MREARSIFDTELNRGIRLLRRRSASSSSSASTLRRFPFVGAAAFAARANDKRFLIGSVVVVGGGNGAVLVDTRATETDEDLVKLVVVVVVSSMMWAESTWTATSSGIMFRRRIFRRHGQLNHVEWFVDMDRDAAGTRRARAICEKVTEHDDNGITSKIRALFGEFSFEAAAAAAAAAAVRRLAERRDSVLRHFSSMSESDSDSRSSLLK